MILERRHLKKRITVSSSVNLQFIHIDSKLILQALFNLIENAVKHTSTNTKSIYLFVMLAMNKSNLPL